MAAGFELELVEYRLDLELPFFHPDVHFHQLFADQVKLAFGLGPLLLLNLVEVVIAGDGKLPFDARAFL